MASMSSFGRSTSLLDFVLVLSSLSLLLIAITGMTEYIVFEVLACFRSSFGHFCLVVVWISFALQRSYCWISSDTWQARIKACGHNISENYLNDRYLDSLHINSLLVTQYLKRQFQRGLDSHASLQCKHLEGVLEWASYARQIPIVILFLSIFCPLDASVASWMHTSPLKPETCSKYH